MLALIAFGVVSSVFVSKTFPFQLQSADVAIADLSLPSVSIEAPPDPVLTAEVMPSTLNSEEYGDALLAFGDGRQGANATATSTAEPDTLYSIYTVQAGDTVSSIAGRFGLTVDYLLWNNPVLRDGDFIAVGDTLFIPPGNGMLHWVHYGETLSGIAGSYGVSTESILSWPRNGLASPDAIVEGALIFVPGGVPPAPVFFEPTPAPTPAPTPTPEPTQPPVFVAGAPPTPAPPPPQAAPPPPPPSSSSGLIWPYSCSISRGFGGGHAGIDIDGVCNPSATIVAAHSGTVVFAGGAACCGYGLYVDVQSSNGTMTRYAHLSSIHVSIGQSVSQGQGLGIIGCTGRCTGTHLHFEVYLGGGLVNPLSVLP